LLKGLHKLKKHDNLYVDTSAICNPLAIWACIKHLGIEHVVYASDFYCSHLRGINFPIGNTFLWYTEDTLNTPLKLPYGKEPVLLGLENLRAVKAAFRMLKLSDNDIQKYFWSNAMNIFSVKKCDRIL
jgi:hypothetical protein